MFRSNVHKHWEFDGFLGIKVILYHTLNAFIEATYCKFCWPCSPKNPAICMIVGFEKSILS